MKLAKLLKINKLIFISRYRADILPLRWGPPLHVAIFEFGQFRLDCDRFELYKAGNSVKLERKPMELLILLAAGNGNLITRTEISDRLWGREVFVDTEHGINTAIRKIRLALEDDSEQPRFLLTVTGKGYRFVGGSVVAESKNGDQASAASSSSLPAPEVATPATNVPADTTFPNPAEHRPVKIYIHWRITIPLLAVCLLTGIVLGLNLGGVRDRIFAAKNAGPIHSIAVLPLSNLSGSPSQDYFADGMTDELITALAQNHSLRVISRTSAMQYKGVNRPLRDIARELGVDGILEGSVNRSADHVHVNLQLIYAPTDSHIWAQSYDRDLDGALALPQELSHVIANEAKIAATPTKPQRYVSPEAHDAYLQGRYLWFATSDFDESKKYFERAIELQPDYAAAWDGLADNYAAMAVSGRIPPREAFQKCEGYVHKALELDGSLAEAHNSMAAYYLFGKWDWSRAVAESLRAIDLNPNYAEGHYLLSYVLLAMNRDGEALQEEERSREIDPSQRPEAMGEAYMELRQYDAAINDLRFHAAAQSENGSIRFDLSKAYWLKGMYKESEEELEKGLSIYGNSKLASLYHLAFERGGEEAVERLGIEEAKKDRASKKYSSPIDMAQPYAFAHNKEETLKYLEAAYQEHAPGLVFLQHEPLFDFLHSDPRYRELVKKIGLQPAY